MSTATLVKTLTIEGFSISSTETWDDETGVLTQKALAAGKAGSLTTRTGNSDGIVTATAAHGYTDATTFAVYWTGGKRYGMTCSSYNATTLTLTGGAGDNFPTALTAVTVCSETTLDLVFSGSDVYLIWVISTRAGHMDIRATASSEWAALLAANIAVEWTENSDRANPITGDAITTIRVSNGTTNSAVLTVGIVKEATA